jgi:hypothetical protein
MTIWLLCEIFGLIIVTVKSLYLNVENICGDKNHFDVCAV